MITTGFYCDECRVKYVHHRCKLGRLPCGHSFKAAFDVFSQAFGRRGEHVSIIYRNPDVTIQDVWISAGERRRYDFIEPGAWTFWGMRVRPFNPVRADWEMWVGEWLSTKSDAFVRAFLYRWESQKFPPEWVSFREHPDAKRACALVPSKRIGFFYKNLKVSDLQNGDDVEVVPTTI